MVEFTLWDILRNLLLAIGLRQLLNWAGPRFVFGVR